jgi:hypothetical protein
MLLALVWLLAFVIKVFIINLVSLGRGGVATNPRFFKQGAILQGVNLMETEQAYTKTFDVLVAEAAARKIKQDAIAKNVSSKEIINKHLSQIREKINQSKINKSTFSVSHLRAVAAKRRLTLTQKFCEVA